MGFIGDFFHIVLVQPLTNLFVLLTTLTGSAGVAVILVTIIIRVVTLPLTLKQMHSTRMMAAMAPRMQEIQKKFKDPQRRSQEQMKLYREAGINPLGCFSSMLLQIPILAALYQTFSHSLGEAPEALINLSGELYNWAYLRSGMPLPAEFLWLHLGRPDAFVIPLLVAITTYVLQKMTMMPATTEQQRAQNQMMNLLMPLMFGWITISLPSGLGLYYVLSNVIGMVLQYLYVGGGAFNWRALLGLSDEPVLPKALEVRQRNQDRFRSNGQDEPDADDETSGEVADPVRPKAMPPARTARTRRRNDSGGRRRSRR